jgi:glycosyltransferase involved in cell wall biosynthesis
MLKIIGNGPMESEYKEYVKNNGLEENIKFFGHLDHGMALEEISKSGIGLALYNGNWNFNYYGDSMKCREYFCFGLPVITTDTHSTVDDIRRGGAGIVCAMDSDSYSRAITSILENYDYYSNNSKKLSECYVGLHAKILDRISL